MLARIDTLRAIETPEGVDLSLRVAGPHVRALAYLIDLAIRVGIMSAVGTLLGLLGGLGYAVGTLLWFGLEWLYPVFFEVLRRGATPGKSVLGLAVLRSDGRPIGWSHSLVRNLLRGVDFAPLFYGFGLASMLSSSSFQRIGDRVADSVVVHVTGGRQLARLAQAAPLAPSVALAPAEQAALVEFAQRVHTWPPARAAELAQHLEPLTGERGAAGVERTLALASWVGGER